ncbi:MAG: leucyl aminopeptidase [Myxococcota bacterium]
MTSSISVSGADPRTQKVDTLALGVPEGEATVGLCGELLGAIPGGRAEVKRQGFTGQAGQVFESLAAGAAKAARLVLIGLGPGEELDGPAWRRFAAEAARRAAAVQATTLAVVMPAETARPDDDASVAHPIAQGVVLGGYRFERYKTGDRAASRSLRRVVLLTPGRVTAKQKADADLGRRVAAAVCRARDLINTAPNDLYPEAMADYARSMAKEYKDRGLTCRVLKHGQLLTKGMNLIDAVGRGSARKPVLIHLQYKPKTRKGAGLKRLVFVGKGVTFDTGGICIKPAPGMEEMKGDMGGAANTIALMAAVAETMPEAEVHGIVGSAENMPDGDAYRPGDIFRSYSGKTVEVINTDAEGRLVLADALHYATELEPDFIMDNATLTGAMVVSLGMTYSGFFSNREELAEALQAASVRAGERLWHLPLIEELREKLQSKWADLKHVGDRWGGAITAALFLQEFVGDIPWIHVDVAGPSMASKDYDIYTRGGTGQGVLTYLELIEHLIQT